MTDTLAKAEAELKLLEGPAQALALAQHDLATLQSLYETTPHQGAREAIRKDMPAAERRLREAQEALIKQREHSGVTPAMIDAAAQRVINARANPQESGDGKPA